MVTKSPRQPEPRPQLGGPLRAALVLFGIILVAGTIGYVVVEGWTAFDALYMTVITLTTVGFLEVHPLGTGGRVLTMVLVVTGVATFLYVATAFAEYAIGGALTGKLRSRRMERRIGKLNGHYIVCGYGRVGEQVVRDLEQQGQSVVVVESTEAAVARLEDRHPHLVGDATDDSVLAAAGIARAKGLVAATGDDASNIVMTLTARAMNAGVVIVARSDNDASEPKLLRAGATRVISPYRIAGRRIATQLLHPSVTDFLDLVMHSSSLELWLKDVRVEAGSELEGRTLGDLRVRDDLGVNILAVSGAGSEELQTALPSSYPIRPGDRLVVLGTDRQLEHLAEMAQRPGGPARTA